MRKIVPNVGLVFALLLVYLMTSPRVVQAGWKSGNQNYFQEEQVCRDGMVVRALFFTSETDFELGFTRSFPLNFIHYTNTLLPPITDDFLNRPIADYGPALRPSFTIVMTYQPNSPLVVDTSGDGTSEIYYVHTLQTITWAQLLAPGDKVLANASSGVGVNTVQDCLLNRLTLNEGATALLDHARLSPTDDLADAAWLRYTLDTPPANGMLLLNGAPLAAGASFSQADIDAGQLSYHHSGSETSDDSFAYSVRGIARVSLSAAGAQAEGGASGDPSISLDGARIAYESTATNLVRNDTGGRSNVYVFHQRDNSVELASVDATGGSPNGDARNPALTADGFHVAFDTSASDLLNGANPAECTTATDTNGLTDVYVRRLGSSPGTERRSVSSFTFGSCNPASGGSSTNPSISNNAFEVAFASEATNLVSGDTNSLGDVFAHETTFGGFTRRISLASGFSGAQALNGASSGAAISADGEWTAFYSHATNLVSGDTNNRADVFVRSFDTTVRVSLASNGAQGTPPGSPATAGAFDPSISYDGRFVAFEADYTNLVSGDTNGLRDIFVRDRDSDADGTLDEVGAVTTTRVSVASNGTQANGASFNAAIATSGRFVAFESDATNLVPGDTNGRRDIFLRDLATGQTSRVSGAYDGSEANGSSRIAAVSADGRYVAFESEATNLVAGDTNGLVDVFVAFTGYSSSFALTVSPLNDPPAIVAPGNQSGTAGQLLGPLALTISDPDTPTTALTVTAESANQTIIPDQGLVVERSGATWTLRITPAASVASVTVVALTVRVSDGVAQSSASFNVTVSPPDLTPGPAPDQHKAHLPLIRQR